MWLSTIGFMLAFGFLVAPYAVEAQQPTKVPRIGVLAVEGGMVAAADRFQGEFREALHAHGYIEGQTILIRVYHD